MQRSKLALAAGVFGAVGIFDPALGAALAHFGVLEPMSGFQLFGMGLVTGLVAGVLALVALYATRPGSNRSGRPFAYVGIAAFALAAFFFVPALTGDLPGINDISTDLVDPPAFANDPAGRDRDMSFPAGFAEQIKATPSYQDLQPIRVARPPADVLREAEAAAHALDWRVAGHDPASGRILASQTTKLFRFVDDIVIRVRDDGTGGSVVDVRSKSRDGQGDIGANAARIRRFYEVLPK